MPVVRDGFIKRMFEERFAENHEIKRAEDFVGVQSPFFGSEVRFGVFFRKDMPKKPLVTEAVPDAPSSVNDFSRITHSHVPGQEVATDHRRITIHKNKVVISGEVPQDIADTRTTHVFL